jgi:hypothetical protein
VRRLKLPGLRETEKVMMAIQGLIDADWLMPAPKRGRRQLRASAGRFCR